MQGLFDSLEKPLPKPTSIDYASARLLEALLEALLALSFLEKGLTRNAAGKAFQAWRALLAAIARMELDRLLSRAGSDEERRWLRERAVPRLPTSRLKRIAQMLEELGYEGLSALTSLALDLHDYQYHGPDPDMAVSRYRSRSEAARDVVVLVRAVAEKARELSSRIPWSVEHENAYARLVKAIEEAWKRLEE